MNHPVTVYTYTDIKSYLHDFKEAITTDGAPESFEAIAKRLGLSSRTKAKKIFKGALPMSKRVLDEFATNYQLAASEKAYLDLLRKFEEVVEPELALVLYRKILEFRRKHLPEENRHELTEQQLDLLKRWYYLPVLSYFDLSQASGDPGEIVKAFRGKLSPEEAVDALECLTRIGLLIREESGKLKKSHAHVSLLDGLPRSLVKGFHKMMIERALDSVYGMPQEKRYLVGATIPIRASVMPVLKKRISDFVLELNREFSAPDADSVYHFSTQLFHLADQGKSPADDQNS